MKSLLFGVLPLVVLHLSGIIATKPAPIVFAIQVLFILALWTYCQNFTLHFRASLVSSTSSWQKSWSSPFLTRFALQIHPRISQEVFLKLIVANTAVVSVCPIQCDESPLGGVGSPIRWSRLCMDHLSHYQGEQNHEDNIIKTFLTNFI